MAVDSLQKIRITTKPQLTVQRKWAYKARGGTVTVEWATWMVSFGTERTMGLWHGVTFTLLREPQWRLGRWVFRISTLGKPLFLKAIFLIPGAVIVVLVINKTNGRTMLKLLPKKKNKMSFYSCYHRRFMPFNNTDLVSCKRSNMLLKVFNRLLRTRRNVTDLFVETSIHPPGPVAVSNLVLSDVKWIWVFLMGRV